MYRYSYLLTCNGPSIHMFPSCVISLQAVATICYQKNNQINMRSWNISKTPTTQQLFHFLARLLWSLQGLWGLGNLVRPEKMRRAYWDNVHLHTIKWRSLTWDMLGVLWTMIFHNDTAIVTAKGIWTWTFLTSEDRLQGGAPIFRFFQY